MDMDQSGQEFSSRPDAAKLSELAKERRMVDFASRLLLALNLLLAGCLCFLALVVIPFHTNIFAGLNAKLPTLTEAAISIPPMALCGSVAGLAAGLIILEVVARRRKTKIVCNAAAVALLVMAIVFVDTVLMMPLVRIGTKI
jgi:type II secretory pathway component PulF